MIKTHLLLRVLRNTEQSKNLCNNVYSKEEQMSDERRDILDNMNLGQVQTEQIQKFTSCYQGKVSNIPAIQLRLSLHLLFLTITS